MPDNLHSFLSPSSHRNSPFFTIALIVIIMHFLLLAIGTLWNPSPLAPNLRAKMIVQTVRLKPFESTIAQTPTPIPTIQPIIAPMPTLNAPIEQAKMEMPPISQPLKEEIPPQLNLPLQQEAAPFIQATPIKKEESQVIPSVQEATPTPAETPSLASPTLPVKGESKPQPKTPSSKPASQEIPKTTDKKSAPVKKPSETAKKSTKVETAKSKPAEEAEKKRQREQAEAEKKRQQEIVEIERKKQQEAEAERKRKQEIAAAQETARQKEQALLAKAKETLAKMGETRDKISSSSSSVNLEAAALPQELGDLQVDALKLGEMGSSGEWGTKEMSYSDEVAYRLKMALRFPDYGAVKIKLTLDRTGRVVKVETIQSESSKNQAYVESKIPTLLFPSFGQRFQGVSQNTFVFTLQNDS